MRILLIIVLILAFSLPAHAEYKFAENWSKTDTATESVFMLITSLDWAQTRWMVDQGWKWDGHYHHEMNPFLGKHPSMDKVNVLIPAAIIGHALVAMTLPPTMKIFDFKINPRRIWQVMWIGVESAAVIHNINVGVKFDF